jgi:hypothetical protein
MWAFSLNGWHRVVTRDALVLQLNKVVLACSVIEALKDYGLVQFIKRYNRDDRST